MIPVRVTFDASIIDKSAPAGVSENLASIETARNALEQIVREACTYRRIRAKNIRVEVLPKCVECRTDCLGDDCECVCHARQGALL